MTLASRAMRVSVLLSLPLSALMAPHAAARDPLPQLGAMASTAEPADPRARVGSANAEARIQPSRSSYLNAIQQYPWSDGALFQIYTAPGQITDIALQEGEELVGPGPVASGDTVRWIIGDTVSGSGAARRVHILVKPTRAGIATNLVINTSRRTYHVELRATTSTYMAGVSWTYPQDELIALRAAEAERERTAPIASNIDITALDFNYRISGAHTSWRPVRVFDDGRQVFVEFDERVGVGDMPPLFVLGDKDAVELVNYRVQGRYMIVDRLFNRAQLRLGARRKARQILIERASSRRRGRT